MAARTSVATLRLLYVEDDPALRAMLAQQIEGHPAVDSVEAAAGARDALAAAEAGGIDAAILDVSLGASQVNGFELGIALRSVVPELPIVMLSQHRAARIEEVLPEEQRHHWSYAEKRGIVDIDGLVGLVQRTILGKPEFAGAGSGAGADADVLARLTTRQREVMALAATGLDARAIADRLHLAHVSVRRELSRAYKVLVPGAPAGTDLRTAAVLEYLRHADAVGTGGA